jgi:hypothetical protein
MITLFVLIILGIIFQGVIMFRSGMMYDFGVGYWGPLARDGVWHEALVGQLIKSVPPGNPGLSGTLLVNYHYFYDLLVSLISNVGVPTNHLIYRVFPVIFSILLGIGTYKLSWALFKDKKVSLLSVFFAYFASSFGWIVNLIKSEQIGGESAFWANQPVSMNLNPPFAISLVIIIFTILLTKSYIEKPKLLKASLIILLAGTLIGFKVYAGAILLGGLFVLSLKRIIFEKDFKLIIISVLSLLISIGILAPQSKASIGLIEFKPFWLIDTMIDAGDRVGIPNFTARRFAYLAENKWFHLIVLQTICLILFFIGNLGTRIIGIFGLEKKQLRNDLFILIFSMMFFSFLPPLLFIQKGNAWNIVQFFYYFLYFSSLFAAYSLRKAPLVLTILIVLITPISSAATFRSWLYPNPPAYLSVSEHEALEYLSKQDNGIVLKHPFDGEMRGKFKDPFPLHAYADNTYVSAYSGKSVFIEDVEQQIVLNTDYKGRLTETNRFFIEKDLSWSNKFLRSNNISFIYLPKVYPLPRAEVEYPLKKIFENEEVNIYKVLE